MTTPRKRRGPAGDRASSKQRSAQAATTAANGTDAQRGDTRPGVELLLEKLEGVNATSRNNWAALCPMHEDHEPSLTFTLKRADGPYWGLFGRCTGGSCRASLPDVIRHLGLPVGRVLYIGNEAYARPPQYVEPLPSLTQVDEWQRYLQSSESLWRYVTEDRGVAGRIAHQFRLGYDEGRECYTFPVAGEDGRLANLRRYRPGGKPKMKNLPGHRADQLYPALPPASARAVVVAEGEWDALVARSHGLTAVSGTAGAATWLPEWSVALAGRDVAFVYDCDEAGREGAAKAAADVARIAKSVRIVDLGLHEHGDVSDWFGSGRTVEELRRLINATAVAGAKKGGGRRE